MGSSRRWWGRDRRAAGRCWGGGAASATPTAVRRCADMADWLSGRCWLLTVVVGVVAFLIGRGVSTPAQQAARARAPAASLLTAPVVLTHARTTVVLRGTLTDGGAISVGVPGDLSGDLAVVTAVATSSGASVDDGSLIAAVAGRPVFVLRGQIPAYSTMSYGTSGIEVSELQAALEAAGFGIGSDTAGTYGAGTAAAVAVSLPAGRLRAGDRAGSGGELGRQAQGPAYAVCDGAVGGGDVHAVAAGHRGIGRASWPDDRERQAAGHARVRAVHLPGQDRREHGEPAEGRREGTGDV